jgi:mycothiol synthase
VTAPPPGGPAVEDTARLDPRDVDAVVALLQAATAADGVRPVSEEGELRLRHGGPAGGRDLVVRDPGGDPVGYARLEQDDAAAEVELVVHPAHRRRGVGTALLGRVVELAGPRPLSGWAHGDLPAATALAGGHGFDRVRVLLQMRRPLDDDAGAPAELPEGVHVAAFRPGVDEQAWLRVNARAFATHPEQGRWTEQDLLLREAEPWFDPAGFLLAWRGDPGAGGTLLGFHWTKVHPPGDAGPDAVGEVYVLGVDPGGHRRGLGSALSVAGLRYLAGRGLTVAMLYVDESNAAAVALYRGLGFQIHATDVGYRSAR